MRSRFVQFIFLLIVSTSSYATAQTISDQLGWVLSPTQKNVCGGYYRELPILYIPSTLVASQSDNYDITADQTFYSLHGTSTLKGHVKVTQPDAELTADIAHIYPDAKTGKPKKVKGVGHVRLREPGKLVIAKHGEMDLETKIITLHDVLYRMSLSKKKTELVKNEKTGKFEKHLYAMNAWGHATKAKKLNSGVLQLRDATYTTCPPNGNCWKLKASSVTLNKQTGRGYSLNNRFLFHGFPILYLPYFNFPIDSRRQTGFLIPSLSSSSRNGETLNLPFYWNIAPNYDATFTPVIMYKRGVLWDGLFRYLTTHNNGHLGVGYIQSDREFRRFKRHAVVDWKGQPTLNDLLKSNDNRRSLTWQNHWQYNQHWTGDVDYNYLSDDYFIQDFGDNMIDNSDNQLPRQGIIRYAGNNWNFLGNFQYYQTLHPVNQAAVGNQYARIPQLKFGGDFPDRFFGLDYSVNTELTRFWMHHNPDTNVDPVIGNRASVRPAISWPILYPFAFFTPRVQLQVTKYGLGHEPTGQPRQPGIAIPIFDLHTGLYFDRAVHFFHHLYRQTLEPQIYYLYVPYRNQNRFPLFDTGAQAFSYDYMFLDNRFSGVDRVGDANQMTASVTTRFIDDNTGEQKASASIGQIHYFRDRKVGAFYGPDSGATLSSTDQHPVSPIAAAGLYQFNPAWQLHAGLTWNSLINGLDNQNIGFQYRPDDYHIIDANYNYTRGGDLIAGEPEGSPKNDLKQTDVGLFWRLTNRWSVMGRWNYNWSHQHAQAYFYGVAYESCCWAVRVMAARTFVSTGPAPRYQNTYDKRIYLQFALKGLGNVGSQPDTLLTTGIPGYVDTFGQDN